MYYKSKSEFYFRQYVLPVCTIVISIGLIFTGVYIYWASNSSNVSKQNLVTASNEPDSSTNDNDESLALVETTSTNELIDLPNLELSESGKITNVDDIGKLTFNYNNKDYILTMIGINMDDVTDDFIKTLKKDLLQKEVKVAFDNTKTEGTSMYAYVYLDNKLYNEYLLESGIAKYKEEQSNTTYKSDFIQAQAYAKQLNNGVWKNN